MSRSSFGASVRFMSLVLIGCAVLVAAGLDLNRGFYALCNRDAFFVITLASTAIVFLHVRPMREIWQLAVATVALVALQSVVLRVPVTLGVVAGLVGVSGLGLLAIRTVRKAEPDRLLQCAFLQPLLFVLLGYAGAAPLELTRKLHPKTWDASLYVFDASLGIQLSFLVGRLVLWSRWLTRVVLCLYYMLPAVLMLVYARQLVRSISFASQVFLAFFVAGPLGVIFYNLLPACGPIYLVGKQFPMSPASMQQLKSLVITPVAINGARNAFPSLHLAWALLAWWYSSGTTSWTERFATVFLAGTAVATLALGEHYFVDLVVAFPFALMVDALCRFNVKISSFYRWGSILSGLALLLGWTALLRLEPVARLTSPIVPWMLIVFTVGWCGLLHFRLQKSANARAIGPASNIGVIISPAL
jgi:hypothetical protein